jgi:hypothetical protein
MKIDLLAIKQEIEAMDQIFKNSIFEMPEDLYFELRKMIVIEKSEDQDII